MVGREGLKDPEASVYVTSREAAHLAVCSLPASPSEGQG